MSPERRLYVITPDEPSTALLLSKVEASLAGGAHLVQYRNKAATPELRREQAAALLRLCRAWQRPLLINDHLELALDLGADGVHLGGDDGDIRAARQALGPTALLGASCYASLERARAALDAGASYVAFGALFPSGSKPNAPPASLQVLREARALPCPVCGIGGITHDNAALAVEAGADWLAVIGSVFGAQDVRAATAQLAARLQGA